MHTRSMHRPRRSIIVARVAAMAAAALLAAAVPSAPAPVRAADPPGVSLSGRGTASLDGVMGPGEWDRAGRLDYLQAMPNVDRGGVVPASVYVMNDDQNLYVAARLSAIPGCSFHPTFEFDSDHDGDPAGLYSDWLSMHVESWASGHVELLDQFVYPEQNVGLDSFTAPGYPPAGTIDGAAAGGHAASTTWAELSHPLNSADDVHDFSLALGETIGLLYDGHVIGSGCGTCVGSACHGSTLVPSLGQIRIAAVPADDVSPVMNTGPNVHGDVGSTLGRRSTRIGWSAIDPGGTGIDRYQVQHRTDGGPWSTVTTTTREAITADLHLGRSYEYRVRPRDLAGNWGAWAQGEAFVPTLVQSTASRATYPEGRWSTRHTSSASGGTTRWTTGVRARASFAFTGHAVAWVSATGPTRGRVRVFIDGVFRARVEAHADSTHWKQILFSASWATRGRHTIELRNGKAGDRLEVDAFVVYR